MEEGTTKREGTRERGAYGCQLATTTTRLSNAISGREGTDGKGNHARHCPSDADGFGSSAIFHRSQS